MAGLVAALYLGTSKVLLEGYRQAEHAALRRQVGYIYFNLIGKLDDLAMLAQDSGAHAGLDTFVAGRDKTLVRNELNPMKLENLRVDFLAVVARDGEVLLSQTSSAPPPPDRQQLLDTVRRQLRPGSPLLRHETVHDVNTLTVALPSRPIFIASAPVVSTYYGHPIRASLVMATPFPSLNVAMLERLDMTLKLHPLSAPLSPELKSVVAALRARSDLPANSPPHTLERIQSEARTTGYILVEDRLGIAPFLFEVEMPRVMYLQALRSRTVLLLVVALVSAFFVALASYFMHRFILSSLGLLSQGVQRVAQAGSAAERLDLPGNDEFAKLAEETNGMLGALELAQRSAQESATRWSPRVSTTASGT